MTDAEHAAVLRELLGPPGYWHDDKRAAIERAIELLEREARDGEGHFTMTPGQQKMIDSLRRAHDG